MERNCEPMNKNRIEGATDQGEQAVNCKAFVVKEKWRRFGGCAVKDRVLTWGDLASCLKGRRSNPEREVSRGRSSCHHGAKGRRNSERMLLGSLDWNVSDVRSAKLAKGSGRVKPKPIMAVRNPSGRIRKRQTQAVRRGNSKRIDLNDSNRPVSSSQGALPLPSPPRTGRATFAATRSRLSVARR